MRCFRSSSDDAKEKAELATAVAIDDGLRRDAVNKDKEVKLLLLGSGESGKSTFARQMKILFQGEYETEECKAFTYPVWANCLTALKAVVGYSVGKEHVLWSATALKSIDWIRYTTSVTKDTSADMREILPSLLNEPAIADTVADIQKGKYKVPDSTPYFLENLDRIFSEDYIPTLNDILRTRLKTLGIYEFRFTNAGTTWVLVDVGGQRSERRKWIHCFDEVTAILFCVALNEYDLGLEEEPSVSRMHESLALFNEICTSSYFTHASIILLLNKEDLFREKVGRVDLNICFPTYTGGKNYNSALAFIKKQFSSDVRPLYTHVATAINTENVKFVMSAVLATVLEKRAEDFSV